MEIKTDMGAYTEGPAPKPGPAGWTFVDPLSGAQVLRLTDERDGPACGNFYSYWPTANRDCTRLLATVGGGTGLVVDFDPAGFKRAGSHTLPSVPGAGSPVAEGSVWSGADPEILYTHVGAQIHAYNARTRTYTLVADLSKDLRGEYLYQMSKSLDDNRFAFTRRSLADGSFLGICAYDRRAGRLILKEDLELAQIDEATIDKTGRFLVRKTRLQGKGLVEQVVYDLDKGTRIELIDDTDKVAGHGDAGTDSYVGGDNFNNQLNWRRLSDPKQVRTLLTFPDWTQSIHTSMLADDESWALVGLFGETGGPAPLRKELVQVATDGSGRVRRLLHHRSVYRNYEDSPRANISRDGRFVFYTSNMGGARTDLYVAKIEPAGGVTTTPIPVPVSTPTPTPAPAQAQYEWAKKAWPSGDGARLALLNQMGGEGWLPWAQPGTGTTVVWFYRVTKR